MMMTKKVLQMTSSRGKRTPGVVYGCVYFVVVEVTDEKLC